jgi:hypothetical protein
LTLYKVFAVAFQLLQRLIRFRVGGSCPLPDVSRPVLKVSVYSRGQVFSGGLKKVACLKECLLQKLAKTRTERFSRAVMKQQP